MAHTRACTHTHTHVPTAQENAQKHLQKCTARRHYIAYTRKTMCYSTKIYIATLPAICRSRNLSNLKSIKSITLLAYEVFSHQNIQGPIQLYYLSIYNLHCIYLIILFKVVVYIATCTVSTTDHHHTVQVAWVQVQYLCQWLNEKHHQRKLQLVTTTTCASGMFAPVERRKAPPTQGPKVRM